MSLIEKEPTGELLVPPGIEVAPIVPAIGPDDSRPMWEIMGYESLDDLNDALFPEEVVEETMRAQRQRVESARAVDLRQARCRIGLAPLQRERPVGMTALLAALQTGIDEGRIYLFE